MHEIPPPEAFEPQPDEVAPDGRIRQRIQAAIAVIVVVSLLALAVVESGGLIIRSDTNPTPAAVPTLAIVDGAGALSTVDGLGGSTVSYAVPGVAFQFPAWSPDGRRIAAIGLGADGNGIYVFEARPPGVTATDPRIVYKSLEQPPFYLFWTPDGNHLTFLTTETDGLALRIAPADASAKSAVVRAGSPMYWDFVDEVRMLVHSGTPSTEGFFGEVALDGTPFDGTGRAVGVFRAPAVSRDDRYRAYLAAADGAIGEVVRESRDGSGTTRIRVFGPAAVGFSPTGDGLAFIAPDDLTSEQLPLPVGPLRILDPGAAEPRTLLRGGNVAFFWSPNGAVIATLRLNVPDDQVTEAVTRPAVGGLGLQLAFVEVADGSIVSERAVQVSDLFLNQVLPFFDQYALSHRFWSPDGSAIALPVVGDDDVTRLLLLPADGSDARVIATAEMGSWSR